MRGIAVYGRQRTRHTELSSLSTLTVTASAAARGGDEPARSLQNQPLVLASYQSKPLIEDVRVINKVSQNLHAEILLRLLGREKGTAGTVEGGLEVLRGFLNQAGVASDQYAFYDGSGLSRQNLVTPHTVVQLLRYADSQPWGASFRDTLPLAGTDGSLSDRFKGVDVQGRVRAKTGSLGGVKTLSGYATTNRGEQVAFSILSNNFNLPDKRINETIDNIVGAILDDGKEEVVVWRGRSPANVKETSQTHLRHSACALRGSGGRVNARPAGAGWRLAHPFQQFFQHNGVIVMLISRGEQQRKSLFLARQPVQFVECLRRLRLSQLLQIAFAESQPAIGTGYETSSRSSFDGARSRNQACSAALPLLTPRGHRRSTRTR